MSIDYGQLKALVEVAPPGPWEQDSEPRPDTSRLMLDANGEYMGIMHTPGADLAALAPDMARELLRLRDGVAKVLEMCLLERDAAFQDSPVLPMRAGEVTAFNICAEQLTNLLDGDAE